MQYTNDMYLDLYGRIFVFTVHLTLSLDTACKQVSDSTLCPGRVFQGRRQNGHRLNE